MSNGYECQIHQIQTSDGYILTAYRIPYPISEKSYDHSHRQPVILQHGLLDNSATWILNKKSLDLPYLLVDQGYDVWLTNSRGTIKSTGHIDPVKFDWRSTFSKYWDFTFDEMGQFDIKANIEYIVQHTKFEKIVYIGHSQGTTQFFAAGSNNSDWLSKRIKHFYGLGPVIYVQHVWSPTVIGLRDVGLIDLLQSIGLGNALVTKSHLVSVIFRDVCFYTPALCWSIVELITGRNSSKRTMIDLSRMPVLAAHEPGGTSVRNISHWMQAMGTSRFQKYDFGEEELNVEKYGSKRPPRYEVENLKNLQFGMDLFIGQRDYLIAQKDAEKMLKLLPDDRINVQWLQDYAHCDYVWSVTAMNDIYVKILQSLKRVQ